MPAEAMLMTDVVGKLRNLRTYLPDASDDLIHFAAYYAEKLGPGLAGPDPVAMYWDLCVFDVMTGRDGFESKALSNPLVGRNEIVYVKLALSAEKVFMAVLPKEFALEAVAAFWSVRR